MRCLEVRDGEIIIITTKSVNIIKISATNLDTTTKHRTTSQERSGNKRREIQISSFCMNHHISFPAKFSELFFKQFDLAMRLKKEELKRQGKVNVEVSEVTEEDLIDAFGVTKDQM